MKCNERDALHSGNTADLRLEQIVESAKRKAISMALARCNSNAFQRGRNTV